MELFTERELKKKSRIEEKISVSVWNGIVAIMENMIANNVLSRDFPESCNDGMGICGCDKNLLYDAIKARISNIEIPIDRKDQVQENTWWSEKTNSNEIDTFATLDLIEFLYLHISEPIKGSFHRYFNHYHYTFKDNDQIKDQFREDINDILRINEIVYFLDENGEIKRVVPREYQDIISYEYLTTDDKLNELISEAITRFQNPRFEERKISLEKLWDAFERMKTYYSSDKKQSVNQLIKLAANENTKLEEELQKEAKILTVIGNTSQIRHFETNQIELKDSKHVDYLFYRLFAFIHLIIRKIRENNTISEK
jgi:hypothetical protein